MPPRLPTFGPTDSRQVQTAFQSQNTALSALEARIAKLESDLADATSRILTLQQINAGLSASGAFPLNVSGLVGSTGVPL